MDKADEHVMSSAEQARAGEAAARVLAAIEANGWTCVDGPKAAYFEARSRQGEDKRQSYVKYAPMAIGPGDPAWGHRDLEVLVGWMPDLIQQCVEKSNLAVRQLIEAQPGRQARALNDCNPVEIVDATTHNLVWRVRPEFSLSDGRWYGYMRLGFIAKDAWFLDMEEA